MLRLTKRRASDYRYVFILTYGRSGSTLLMGILNSLPHYCIRGENNNVLYRLFEAHKSLTKARVEAVLNSDKLTNPWFGLNETDPHRFAEGLIEAFVANVLKPGRSHTTIGFKEIRHSYAEISDFDGYIAFIRERFAGCRIIFNHRNLEEVVKSKWWSTMPTAREKLQLMEDRFNAVPDAGDLFHFNYDQIDRGLGHVRDLFEFLGEPFNEAAIRAVLDVKHSY